jgi:hypothetical protein
MAKYLRLTTIPNKLFRLTIGFYFTNDFFILRTHNVDNFILIKFYCGGDSSG